MRNVHASDVLHRLFRFVIGAGAAIETSPPPSRNVGVDPTRGIEAQVGKNKSDKEIRNGRRLQVTTEDCLGWWSKA